MFKKEKVICRAPECFNTSNNSLEKWQLDLCTTHLIDFMKWFEKDEKIRAVSDKYNEKWELIKNSNNKKAQEKIKNKLVELQVYFNKQKQLALEFEHQSKLKLNATKEKINNEQQLEMV